MCSLHKIQHYFWEVTVARPSTGGSLKQAQWAALVVWEQQMVTGAAGEDTDNLGAERL